MPDRAGRRVAVALGNGAGEGDGVGDGGEARLGGLGLNSEPLGAVGVVAERGDELVQAADISSVDVPNSIAISCTAVLSSLTRAVLPGMSEATLAIPLLNCVEAAMLARPMPIIGTVTPAVRPAPTFLRFSPVALALLTASPMLAL
jgi:hypothetical protein